MRGLFSHFRCTVRVLLKSPGFTITTILILGFGIGVNTAMFSFINGVVLKPLPYPKTDRLVFVAQTYQNFNTVPLGYADYLDFKAGQHSFENLAVCTQNNFTITGHGGPDRFSGLYVDGPFFQVFGRPFIIGQPFGESADNVNSSSVVVISEHLWRTRFHADPRIVGTNISLDGRSFQVVGVTPGEADEIGRADLYVPVSSSPLFQRFKTVRTIHDFLCFGRLKEGSTLRQAQAELEVLQRGLAISYPKTNAGFGIRVARYLDTVVGAYAGILWILEAAVACLLLITCANLANLLLTRAKERRKEMTIRAALGAGRLHLVLQLLAESSLLAVIGGAIGLLIAFSAVELIKMSGPADLPRFQETRVDGPCLLFVFGVTLLATLLFGLFPAWAASKANLVSDLKEEGERTGTTGPQRQRSQALLVGGQVALAALLLVGAGLLTRSFQALQNIPLGFNSRNILTAEIFLPDPQYADQAKCNAFFDALLDKVGDLPGVTAAALNDNLPFSNQNVAIFGVAGQPDPDTAHMPILDRQEVSPNYFHAVGIPILRGRLFNDQDQASNEKVVIISESIAKKYFAGQDPIGKQIDDFGDMVGLPRTFYTIVGVAANIQHDNPESDQTGFQGYYPYAQASVSPLALVVNSGTLLVKTAGDPYSALTAVRKVISTLDPDVPLANVSSFDDLIAKTFAIRRVAMMVVTLFSAVALLLAAVGLYAVLSYSVIQRTHEIGVRMALGAPSWNILSLVIGQGLRIVGIGLVVGLAAALILFPFVQSVLYGVSSVDGLALASAMLVLGLAASLACLLPALRATRINPITALRE